jgi:nitrate/TMAO reductase-like tetraheme cytochrome c subunit
MKKKILIVTVLGVLFFLGLGVHEASIRYFPEKTCIVCHEMRDPIKRWKESLTAKNHSDCASCHFNPGFAGWVDMNVSSAKQLIAHFKRDPDEPLKPKAEPLFLKEDLEPGYWSYVPNSRCFTCKDTKNHKQIDQITIHKSLIKDISRQPCKDCHNHEMRNGQKFYEPLKPIKTASLPDGQAR